MHAFKAFVCGWLLVVLEESVNSDGRYCLAEVLAVHVVLALLVVVHASRLVSLQAEAANGDACLSCQSDVVSSRRTVPIRVVNDHTFLLD